MTARYPTARAFAEALAPAVKWRCDNWDWSVKSSTIGVIHDVKGRFVVTCGRGSVRVGASHDGIQRAHRWLLFMAGEDPKVAAFVDAAGLGRATIGGAP